ncbi:MAG TPA: zinc ribbon domain-containing protein, partial [Ktedonobacteraceae bacterium]
MLCPSCDAPNRGDAKFCKKCGHSFLVEATQVPEAAAVSQVSTPAQKNADTDDPSFAPTQIISPQQMLEFHNRRWQQELEREQTVTTATTEQSQITSDHEAMPLPPPAPAPTASSAANGEARDIADLPTLIINPLSDQEPASIPIPPPPPGVSTDETAPASAQPGEPPAVAEEADEADEPIPIPPPPPTATDAPPIEISEGESAQSIQSAQSTQSTQSTET